MKHQLVIQCAWCKHVTGTKPSASPGVTHGICRPCMADLEDDEPTTHDVVRDAVAAYTVFWRRQPVGHVVASARDDAWDLAREMLIARGYPRASWRLWADVQAVGDLPGEVH